MRILYCGLVFLMVTIWPQAGSAFEGPDAPVLPDRRGPVHLSVQARQVLVTFSDEREARVPISDPVTRYRRRGEYGNSTWSERRAAELATDYGLSQKAQWPITALGVHCVVYEVPEQVSLDAVLRRLAEDRRVESAQSMRGFRVMSVSTASRSNYSDPYLRMQASLRTMQVLDAQRYSTGRNVQIVVIDTGADADHTELKGHVEARESFVPNSPETGADVHGTAVAGIIAAAANNGQGIVGIAPESRVRVMKACWQRSDRRPDAECNTFTLALALNTAIEAKPQIINLSLNGPSDPLLQRLIDKAVGIGIIVVAAQADRPGPENMFPAAVPGVVAVQTESARFPAARNATTSLSAPGEEVLTTVPHDAYGFMTGSSFAAAHVSGVVALLLELNPGLSRDQIIELLRASELPPGPNAMGGHGVDACRAVAAVASKPEACGPVERAGQQS